MNEITTRPKTRSITTTVKKFVTLSAIAVVLFASTASAQRHRKATGGPKAPREHKASAHKNQGGHYE